MFFEKRDIDENTSYGDVVDANVFMSRIMESIEEKFVFTCDYPSGDKVKLDEAEAFMFKLYGILKDK